jgi:uncharacterized protein YdeI (YjbR/CyaY-like superfamily)
MEIGKTLYVADRKTWRSWLRTHGQTKREIWLVYYKKNSGTLRIPYDDAVEEALCFGWIDSILKPIDEKKYAQRFSPRKKGSKLSALNRERVRRLIKQRKMTSLGLVALEHTIQRIHKKLPVIVAKDIIRSLKNDKIAWKHFSRFPPVYKRIRIGWIEAARYRPEIFQQRLRYFLKMTREGKKFGSIQK